MTPGEMRVVAWFANDESEPVRARPADQRHGATDTLVFEVPRPAEPKARLRVIEPDGRQREIDVVGGSVTIGRSADNVVVLADPRASRHHARLQVRRGAVVLTDLGSTNGTRVNRVGVDEVVLGEGDRIEIGDSRLVFEALVET